jgi:4-amino-4-deoxy-L-arabinose transferase-like glycosyltransferase
MNRVKSTADPDESSGSPPDIRLGAGWKSGILLVILLLAATVRLIELDSVPPALHVDEAPNAWNAYCLLKTGMDQNGIRWPIFYTRAFGDNRTTSYVYALIPFQAAWGMNVWTTRLPAALGGVGTVLLLYFVGARLFGAATGLAAAAMLALNPWHIQATRWGHEASLTPFLVMLSLATLLWAHLPFDDDEQRSPSPATAVLAGAIVGISCYGYAPVRLFLPCFLVCAVLVTWKGWRERLKAPKGAVAICALVAFAGLFLGPLLWRHISDPAISQRARNLGWVWSESDTLVQRIGQVLLRYAGHFGLDFLFITGDRDPALSPPGGTGLFLWYDLPLMVLGLVMVIRRTRASRAARFLLAWVLLYPVGDLFYPHVSLHALRSLPGLCGLVLLAALGFVGLGEWIWRRRRTGSGRIYGIAIVAIILALNVRFIRELFGEDFRRQKSSVSVYTSDVLEAAQWLRPQLKDVDAVFITGLATHADIVTLVGLEYDPRPWFREPRDMIRGPLPDGRFRFEDLYLRYGKIHFMLTDSSIAELEKLLHNGRPDRVVFIVRPGELGLDKHGPPVREIRDPEGRPVLWIFDLRV